MKMPRCACWGSENESILKGTFGQKTYPCILKGSSAYSIPILWCNIKLKYIIPKVIHNPSSFDYFGIV